MNIKQLEYFVLVAEHLNFSRAAESLYISQPALSYQISELEKELGQTLFVRDRRNIQLTAAGNALLRPAKAVIRHALELHNIAKHGSNSENMDSGLLRIAFDSTEDHFETTGITASIARFTAEYPNIDLEFSQIDLPRIKDETANRDQDVSIAILLYGESIPNALSSMILRKDRIQLMIRADLPYTDCQDVVKNMELIQVAAKPRRTRSRIMNGFTEMGLTPRIKFIDSMPAGFTYTDMGKGAMLLPSNYYKQHNYQQYRMIDIPGDTAKIAHVAVWSKNSLNPVLPLFLQHLEESFGNPPDAPD